MTLQEAKDQVAKKYGAPDWWSLDFNKTNLSQEAVRDEAALLYGESKWNQACDIQREVCAACYMAVDVLDVTDEDYDEYRRLEDEISAIKNAPIPPFKP